MYKSGYVALVGMPNAGKSTLMNRLLGVKLSITSPRPQTTRRRVMGIYNTDDLQIVFHDTPGLLKPAYALQQKMMDEVDESLIEADAILFLFDLAAKSEGQMRMLETIAGHKQPIIVAINKIDKVEKEAILPVITQLQTVASPKAIIPISALQEDGLDLLIAELQKWIPAGMPFYPPDQLSEFPEKFFVGELIREQTFYLFREEIPYAMEVAIEEFRENDNGKDFIRAVIFVERDSQKGIVIGDKGSQLKKLGAKARKQIEFFLERPVFLELQVKVLDKWRKNSNHLRRLGY
jgi:GTP-binding protein Era